MKTGLGIHQKLRKSYAYCNLIRFTIRKKLLGFDVANQFLQRVDKISMQLILKNNGATIGNNCDIETGLIFHNCKDYCNLIVGNNCHIGKNCFFDLREKVIIGNNVVISMQCSFITHIDMSKSTLKENYKATQKPIYINDNCYLGVGVRLLLGVRLLESVFVAANALIIKNVESHTMVGGVPAKIIKKLSE
ncbi:MAG: acyltransferase [Thiohalospira sp.]